MTTQNVNKLNKLVLSFFENADVKNVEELWMGDDIQKQVKSLLTKCSVLRRKKDPNAHKRGKSAYLFFCTDHRDQVKTDLGKDSKATDVTRELGARWIALKESNKTAEKKAMAGYEKAAGEDKARYESEKVDYIPLDDDGKPKHRGGKKLEKKGPKRAKSAYLYFCY